MLISGLMPAAMSMVGDTVPFSRQGRWIGLLTTAQAVGFAVGPGIGGLLSQTLGFTSPFLLSVGLAFAASLLAVFPFVLGRLSETLPKKPLIVTGSLLFSVLNVFMCAVPLYPLLLAGAALAGLGSAFVEPAMGGIYLSATSDDNRGQVMGMRGSAISLAVMLGPLTQALVGPWITPQITFAIGVVLSLSAALLQALFLECRRRIRSGLFVGVRGCPSCGFSGRFASFAVFGCSLVVVGVPVNVPVRLL